MARYALPVVALIVAPLAFSQDSTLEEIVVTSSFTHQVQGQNESSVITIPGDEVTQNLTQSLGEHLSTTAGVSSNNFGPAVGQPVIRGMGGNRVKVLQNNLVVRDVSGIGPDHPLDLDLSNVEQIEVVRGAAALLHSNGASGGIINIVDNTISRTDIEKAVTYLSAEHQTGNEGEGFNAGFKRNIGGFNINYSFSDFDAQDYEIPAGAILHDDDERGHEDHEEDMGTLANSDFETKTHRFGISKTGDWGYLGASYQDISYTYGIPFHGEHGDHDDDHDDHDGDHDDHDGDDHDGDHDDHDGDDHDGDHDDHEGERIESQTDSMVLSLAGQLNLNRGLVRNIQFSVRDTDYELLEQHAEGEHEGGHEEHSDGPTLFSNDSTEAQVVLNLGTDEQPRRVVFNQVSEKVSVLGDEAFMEPVKSKETTIGAFAGFKVANFDIDIGIRWDDVERKGTIRGMHDGDHDDHDGDDHDGDDHDGDDHDGDDHDGDHDDHDGDDHDGDDHDGDHDDHDGDHDDHDGDHDDHEFELEPFTFRDQSVSAVVTVGRELTDSLSASLNMGLVTRTPSAMELFMTGEHLAVARYEVGDANLDAEKSQNLDFNLRYNDQTWFATASIFRNSVDNYIYLRDETEEEHEEHSEHDHGDLMLAEYMQNDATFKGYELEIGRRFDVAGGQLEVRLQHDQVKGDFSGGGNVPRITPSRSVFAMDYSRGRSRAMVEIQDVDRQNLVSSFETPTSSYRMVNARLSHSIDIGNEAVLTVSAFGRNLTDDVARSHTSFVKNEVPLAGRNIGIKASLSF